MPLGKEEIQHIARLARLTLSESEIEKFSHELAVVVEYFEQLQTIDTSQVKMVKQLDRPNSALRIDEARPSLSQKEALANAPDSDGRFFRVPKVIG